MGDTGHDVHERKVTRKGVVCPELSPLVGTRSQSETLVSIPFPYITLRFVQGVLLGECIKN